MEPWVPAWALRVLATAYYRAGRYEQAIAACNESLISDPTWKPRDDNYAILAMAYHRLNRTSESRDALRLAAEFMDRRINQYDSYEYELHFREAQELLGVEPQDDYRRHLLSARALALLRIKQEALDEYAIAIKLNPDDASIRLEAERLGGP
jgi:tetratricopeptide (TPR) repeat protein